MDSSTSKKCKFAISRPRVFFDIRIINEQKH